MLKQVLLLCLLLCSSAFGQTSAAEPAFSLKQQGGNDVQNVLQDLQKKQFLPVEQAFALDFVQQGNNLRISFQIADDYYLYKHKLKLAGVAVNFSKPQLPAGLAHEDEYFGKTEIYRQQLVFDVPLANIGDDARLKVRFQGCADAGLCYPEHTTEIPLTVTGKAAALELVVKATNCAGYMPLKKCM